MTPPGSTSNTGPWCTQVPSSSQTWVEALTLVQDLVRECKVGCNRMWEDQGQYIEPAHQAPCCQDLLQELETVLAPQGVLSCYEE